jgi:hypothetical protein
MQGGMPTSAVTVTSQLCASGGGIPASTSSFHNSQDGNESEPYLTDPLNLAPCGSHTRGCHDHRRPTYATVGGDPASLRWNGLNFQPPSWLFLASICQMWFPLDLVFFPSSLNREMYGWFHR